MQAQLSEAARSALKDHFLFSSCPEAALRECLSCCVTAEYSPGDSIGGPAIYVLTSGRATVYSVCGGSDFVLRTMRSGDTLGAAALFSAHGEMTRVIADEPTRVLCIPEQAVHRLIARDPDFALRYITFLSDRIRFLNKRLACLSAGSAAARLAAWLDTTVPEGCTDYDLTIPLSRLCSVLDLGRASLYRALDELETGGWLSRSGKHLFLPDRAGMARAYGLD